MLSELLTSDYTMTVVLNLAIYNVNLDVQLYGI